MAQFDPILGKLKSNKFNELKLNQNFNSNKNQTSISWNSDEDCIDVGMQNGVIGQVTQELIPLHKNQTGSIITNGTPVMFAGSLGASGRLLIQKAIGDGSLPPSYTIGIVTEDIANGADGHVTWFGKVRGIDTTGTPYGEVWSDGDILYVSPTTAGFLTNVKPSAPNEIIEIAAVVHAHATIGTLFVRPHWNQKITELTDVDGTALTTTGQFLYWNQSSLYFDPSTNILLDDTTGNISYTGSLLTPLTQGSVPFIGDSGALSEDNSNLFWDNVNKRLGIGTASPNTSLEISNNVRTGNGGLLGWTFAQPETTAHALGYTWTSDPGDQVQGLVFDVGLTAGARILYGIRGSSRVSASGGSSVGAYVTAENYGSNNTSYSYGMRVQVGNRSTGNTTENRGISIDTPFKLSSGQATTGYAIYINSQNTANNNYSIYSLGGKNLFASNNASDVLMTLKAAASQTANLTEWQDSVGNILAGIQADGELFINQDNKKLLLGAGQDSSIYYDGTDLNIDAAEVGSGGVKILSDTFWSGDGTGLPYGHMTNDTGNTITVAIANTWYEVTTGYTGKLTNLVTFADSHYLAVDKAGVYKIEVSASLEGTTAGDKIGVTVMVNGTAITYGHAHSTIGNATDQVGMATSYVLDLAANDQVSVAVINHTAARDVDLIHSSLTLSMVGGT